MSTQLSGPEGPLYLDTHAVRLLVDRAPAHGDVDFEVDPAHIGPFSATFRAGKPASTGEITLEAERDDPNRYASASSENAIARDDRLLLEYRLTDDGPVGAGEGAAGGGPAGDWHTLGDWLVDSQPKIETGGKGSRPTVSLSLVDYVWGVLRMRNAFYGAEDEPIAGGTTDGDGEDSHLNSILDRHCPEINRESIATIAATTDYAAHGLKCDRVVEDLAADAANSVGGIQYFSRGRRLFFEPTERLPRPFADESDPFGPADVANDASSQGDGSLVNVVRVDGGIDVENVGDSQEQVDRVVRANANERQITRVQIAKTQVPAVEIYTRGDAESDDGLRVRLQPSNSAGIGPIDPDNTDADYVTSPVRKVALDDDGFTRFRLATQSETQINATEAWLIIDSEGPEGYQIGVRDNGDGSYTPAYRIHFAKPIIDVRPDAKSLSRHLRHEKHVQDDGLGTTNAVEARSKRELAKAASNARVLSPGTAFSRRAHELRVGDLVPVYWPEHRAVGDMMVRERTISGSGLTVNTELELIGTGALA